MRQPSELERTARLDTVDPPALGVRLRTKWAWAKALVPKIWTFSYFEASCKTKGSKNPAFAAAIAVDFPTNCGVPGTAKMKSSVMSSLQACGSLAFTALTKA